MSSFCAARVRTLALEAGFHLVGFARAEALPPRTLLDWLEAGMAADMDWMAERAADRLDPRRLLPGAETVVALACNYFHQAAWAEASPVALYAQGRDYHATLRDGSAPSVAACARNSRASATSPRWTTPPHGEGVGCPRRAGLRGAQWMPGDGRIRLLGGARGDGAGQGRRAGGLRPGPDGGTLRTLPAVRRRLPHAGPGRRGPVDARRCLSYQTIENAGPVETELRAAFEGTVFGCDTCQDVCPLNQAPVLTQDVRFAPRPVAALDARAMAALTRSAYEALVPGTALARAGFDGLRRNAAYALGAARDAGARQVLEQLCMDANPGVREAARWALTRLHT